MGSDQKIQHKYSTGYIMAYILLILQSCITVPTTRTKPNSMKKNTGATHRFKVHVKECTVVLFYYKNSTTVHSILPIERSQLRPGSFFCRPRDLCSLFDMQDQETPAENRRKARVLFTTAATV